MKVLLIEPDKVMSKLYSTALQNAGHDVQTTASAEDAISLLDTSEIDIVVLELRLAKHNGVEFLHELRSYPEWSHVPVIVHTALPDSHPGSGKAFRDQFGIVRYLYKPNTTLKKLCQVLNDPMPTGAN